jgi:hypothetical protein
MSDMPMQNFCVSTSPKKPTALSILRCLTAGAAIPLHRATLDTVPLTATSMHDSMDSVCLSCQRHSKMQSE